MQLEEFAYAISKPKVYGKIRQIPEDFVVEEMLGFDLLGEGEHHWLRVRKRGWNTENIAHVLAKFVGASRREVGFSGLKDRRAVTTQWFSIRLPGKDSPDWKSFDLAGVEILAVARHNKKLKRGVHRRNRFRLVVRDLAGEVEDLLLHLEQVAAEGVPNYFGPQRFGIEGGNLEHARQLFNAGGRWRGSRHRRGLYISAARAWLFNRVLSSRVAAATWNRALPGDVFQLEGSRSVFLPEEIDDTIHHRIQSLDIHPTGPLWGGGEPSSRGEVRLLELNTADQGALFRDGLEAVGLKQERRSLRLLVNSLVWEMRDEKALSLEFILPRGAYATTVLRECLNTEGET